MIREGMQVMKTNPSKTKIIVICVCVALALAAIGGGIWGYYTYFADDGLILPNVYVADVNIGGKTPEEAKTLVQRQTDLTYPYEDMVVRFPDEDLHLAPADTGIALDIDKLIDDAYTYGRTGTWEENYTARQNAENVEIHLALGDYLSVDTDYIQAQLDAYEAAHTSTFAESTVTLEGDRPALDAANYKAENPCQVIKVYTGNPGRVINMDGILEQIIEAYNANEFLVETDVAPVETLPAAIDLTALHTEHSAAAVDAAFGKKGNEVTINPETYGYSFDLEAAMAQITEAGYDQTLEIPFSYVAPKVLSKDLKLPETNTGSSNSGSGNSSSSGLYQDTLAKYTTYYVNEANRATNIRLAAKAINGKVLLPGEKFDYNTVVGKRTAAKGYKPAPAYSGGKTVQSIGGGICQVSSTLYYCTLIADLKINTRTAHGFVSSYMPLGMDATVSWGGPHFAFTNNTDYPIRIEASAGGGALTVKIKGTNTKDYYVKMEYEVLSTTSPKTEYKKMTAAEAKAEGYKDGEVIQTAYTGKLVKTYKCKYDSDTGKLISRTYEATSNYKCRNKIIVDIVESSTKPTEPKPTEPKPTEPKPTEPKPTEPKPTEPKPTEPKPTEPEPSDPPVEETKPPVEETTPPPADETPGEGEG